MRLGKYELITRLARGGMAEILLARQPGFRDFSRLVVMKRLLPQLADRLQVLEKFPYMSPEQCRGEPLDRRSDLFALGSVFIELLTGRRPFERPSELETIKAIISERIPSASELNPDVPAPLERIVDRAHARERKTRYETAAEMAENLREALEELDLRTSPETLVSYLETDCVDLLVKRSEEILMLCADCFSPTAPTLIRDLQRSPDSEVPTDHGPPTVVTPPKPTALEEEEPESKGPAAGSIRSFSSWKVVLGFVVLVVAGLVGALVWNRGAPQTSVEPPLVLACPPYFERAEVVSGLAPLAAYLSRRLDRHVEIAATKNYSDVIDGLVHARFDIATLSPLPFIQAHDREPRLKLIAAETYESAHTYQSFVVTSASSSLSSANDLEGKRFCYVDESSTSGYLLPRHYLRSMGLDPDRLFSSTILSGTHKKVIEDVIAGRCDAGAIYSGALIAAQSIGIPSSKLRMIAIAGESSGGMMVGAPTLPEELTDAIANALIDFSPQRDLGRATMSTTFPIDGSVKARPNAFATIEAAARAEGPLE